MTLKWKFVRQRFKMGLSNLALTDGQVIDGFGKSAGVAASLNRHYWDESDGSKNRMVVGSWGKNTAIRPPTDIDQLHILPVSVFHDFNSKQGNVQSQLLQEVKNVLLDTYGQTNMRGDGQVVVVSFNSITIEIVPAFPAQGEGFLTCDTNSGGSWKHIYPEGEIEILVANDDAYNGNLRKLTKLLKRWKRECNVPIKSFHIEHLVKECLDLSPHPKQDEFWFDWLIRDVLAYMVGRAGQSFWMPGSSFELIQLGEDWKSRAETAHDRAIKACQYEHDNMEVSAGLEWQKLFGSIIPTSVD
jgi:hypothetical protein